MPLELTYRNHEEISLMMIWGELSDKEGKKKFLNSNEHGHVQGPERVKAGTLVGEGLRAYSWVTHEDKKALNHIQT